MVKKISAALLTLMTVFQPAWAAGKYVSIQIFETGAGRYLIREPSLPLNMHLSASGDDFSFGADPMSGNISKSGSSFSISGNNVNANANAWSGNYGVNATVYGRDSRSTHLNFTMFANGSSDDPKFLPDYTLSGNVGGSNLRARPMSNKQGYEISGFVDMEQFGTSGASLFSLMTAVSLHTIKTSQAASLSVPVKTGAPHLRPLSFPLR